MHDTSLSKCNVTINVLANATIVLITTSISKLIYIFRPMEMKQRGGVSSGMQLGRFQFYIQVTQVTTTTDNNLQLYKVSTTTKQKQNNSKKQTDRQTDREIFILRFASIWASGYIGSNQEARLHFYHPTMVDMRRGCQ